MRSSRLYRSHPDWFLRDEHGKPASAGFNWGERLHALDTTQPAVQDWLAALMRQARAWGFDYFKLDFLYGGALPGVRRSPVPREQALRQALQLMREAMGPDAFFVACGVPILPSLGICDALRVGPDVAEQWESERDERLLHNTAVPGGRTAARTSINRLWLRPLVVPDPDPVYFRSVECGLGLEQKRMLQALALICGFRATSDPPQWLAPDERQALRRFLQARPRIEQAGPRLFRIDGIEVDFAAVAEVMRYGGARNALESAILGWLSNRRWALKIDEWMRRKAVQKRMDGLRERLG